MKLKGFTPDEYILYNLQENDINNYISEKERWYTRKTNNKYAIILDDKLIFYEIFKKYLKIPMNVFYIRYKKVIDLSGNVIDYRTLKSIIKRKKILFLKPIVGGSGKGIFKISFENNFKVNDKIIKFEDLYNRIINSNNFVATKAIKQNGYANEIYPKSVNTIRIITLYDANTSTVCISDALHRFGTSKSKPVDNAGSGGIFAKINVSTGELGEARDYNNGYYLNHPDSNKPIKGIMIPNWMRIKSKCENIAKLFPYIPYIPYMAWDIAVNGDEIEVIEINASTGLTLFQMFEGKRFSKLGEFLREKESIKQ